MTVSLRQLRISADMDSTGFQTGARALEQSSARAGTAVNSLGNSVHQTDTKVSQAGNAVHQLSMRYVEGYSAQVKYEQGLRRINTALETGQITAARAEQLVAGMTQKLAFAGNAAELAAQGHMQLASVVSNVNSSLNVETGQIDLNTAALVRNSAAAKAAHAANDNAGRFRRQNLTYQLFDVGQMAVMGQNPMMTLVQQGPQIAQIYAGQGGVNAAFKDLGTILGTVATRLGPIGVLVGVAAAGVGMLRSEIEESTGVAVSFMDVLKAMVQVPAQAIYDYLQPAIAAIAPWFDAAWDLVIDGFKTVLNAFIKQNAIIAATFEMVTSAIGPLFLSAGEAAANGFISGINWMVEKALAGFNQIIDAANSLVAFFGGDKVKEMFGWDLEIGKVATDALKLPTLDMGGKAAIKEVREEWERYRQTVKDIVGEDYAAKIFDAIAGQAVENAKTRIANTKEELKKAADAAAELKRQFDAFSGRADNLLEQYFPGEAARREAHELIDLLDKFGDKLDSLQRQAVETRIDELFVAASLGLRDLGNETDKTRDKFGKLKDKGTETGRALEEGFSGFLEDLFTGRDLLESIISLGSRLASMNFDMFSERVSNFFGGKGFSLDASAAKASAQVMGKEIGVAIAPVLKQAANDNYANIGLAGSVGAYTNAINVGKSAGAAIAPAIQEPLDRQVDVIAGAIKKIESGNNYDAVGQQTRYGKPLGAYQILESNLPQWSQQALGRVVSASEFLGNRLVQDQIAYNQLSKLLTKYNGSFEDVASVWNSGRPVSQSGRIVDPYNGQSVNTYVSKVMQAVETGSASGAQVGTAKGAAEGTFDAWAGLRQVSTKQSGGGQAAGGGNALMSGLSSALGGFSTGYQGADPLMGALGGAIQGFGAGGPIGAIIGGIAGLIGGFLGARNKVKQARRELEKQMNAINDLLDIGFGKGMGQFQKRLSEYLAEVDKAVPLAWKAKDWDLVDKLHQSWNAMFLRLRTDFYDMFDETMQAYSSGYGLESPVMKGAKALADLREELRNMVADVRYFGEETIVKTGGETGANYQEYKAWMEATVAEAEDAAKKMILAFIGGRQEFTEYESAVMSVKGALDVAQTALEELGMSAEAAAQALDKQLNAALARLQSTFIDDISRSLYELADMDYMSDLLDAQDRYNTRLRDATALGLSADLANRELALSLRNIVREAELTDDQIRQLAAALPELSAGLMGLLGMSEGGDTAQALSDAQAKVEDAKAALRSAYEKERSELEATISRLKSFTEGIRDFRDSLRLDKQLSPLSPYERLMEAQRQFNDVSAKALAGDETAQGRLEDVSRAYLEEARAYYASSEAYFQIFEQVESILDQALATADGQLSNAEKQLSSLEKQVGKLIDLDDGVKSVNEAIKDLHAAQAEEASAQAADDAYKNSIFAEMLEVLKAQLAAQQAADLAQQQAAAASTANYSSSDPVANAYRSILGREPDAAGYAFFSGNLNAGITTLPEIEAALRKEAGMATGGWVTGGTPGVDSVMRMLMPGEYVMPTAQAQRFGPQLDAMRGGWFGAANDNSAVVNAIKAMQRQFAEMMQRLITIEAASGRENVQASLMTAQAVHQQMRNREFESRKKQKAA